jgi:hypothetical protein
MASSAANEKTALGGSFLAGDREQNLSILFTILPAEQH